MAFDSINNRFAAAVHVINASATQRSVDDGVAALVYGSDVVLEVGAAGNGLGFRWNIAGTKTGTNEAHTVNLMSSLSSTPLMTLTADDTTAVDWTAQFILYCYGGAVQKIMGSMDSNSLDAESDYAAGTASLKGGATLYVTIDGHANDTVTSEMCILEAWQFQD